jgi:hypothetical protein
MTIAGYDDMTLVDIERMRADDFERSRRRDHGRQVDDRLRLYAATHHAALRSGSAVERKV